MTTVLIVGGAVLVSYGGVCWYFGFDFLGLSRKRTENLIMMLNTSTPPFFAVLVSVLWPVGLVYWGCCANAWRIAL